MALIERYMMDKKEVTLIMFDAVKSGSFDEVLKAAYQIFQMPIAVCDASFEMLAQNYPPTPQDDLCWDMPLAEKKVPLEVVQIFQEHDLIDKVNQSPGETIFLNWGWFQDHPRLTTAIRSEGGIIGYIAVLCTQEAYQSWQDEALQVVADAMGIMMEKKGLSRKETNIILQSFARELIMGNVQDPLELARWSELVKLDLHDTYVMMAISSPPEANRQELFSFFLRQLKLHTTSMVYHIQGHTLYLLFYRQSKKGILTETLVGMESIMKSIGLYGGISLPFQSLEHISKYREQASMALTAGRKMDSQLRIYFFEKYALETILFSAFEKIQPQNCIHPAINQLKKHDQDNNTDYLDTLKSYVMNHQNVGETCQALHIHRNTLGYRLKKIEETTGIDLKDTNTNTYLLIGFHVLDLMKRL